MCKEYKEVILGGFSQGGMIASHLALKGDIKASKLLLLSSTLVGRSELATAIDRQKSLPEVFISHGLQDPVLSPAIAQQFCDFLDSHKIKTSHEFFTGGHEIPPVVIEKVRSFIKSTKI
jgi:phospholipase/carboxylesterase